MGIIKSFALIALALLFAAAPAPASAQAAPTGAQVIAHIDQQLSAAAAKGFGGAIVIEQAGRTLLAKGYGYADRKRRIAFTPDTMAQIGSITKSQTGAALATLIAEGKLSLSDTVAKFVPEAPEPGRSRTIAELLSHRSGLLDTCTDDFDRQSAAMLIKTCLAKPLAHKPGEDEYSNMGYSVLAFIIQRATGKRWDEAVRERVWEPLGMRDIGFYFTAIDDAQFAHGYLKDKEQPVISREIERLGGSDWALRGNGGLQATARTMVRFIDGLLDPRSALPAAAPTLVLSPVPGQTGSVREGFGWAFRYDDQGKLVRMGHAGSDGIFFSYLCWLPENDVRFYLVGNNGEDEVKAVLQGALKAAMKLPPAPPSE